MSDRRVDLEMLAMKIMGDLAKEISEGDVKAAREYIRGFTYLGVCDRGVMVSALALAVADMIGNEDE